MRNPFGLFIFPLGEFFTDEHFLDFGVEKDQNNL